MKRGTDHSWELVKYNGDICIYARCKCKYHYNSKTNVMDKERIPFLYPYCPMCGAKKKWYSDGIKKINKYSFED